MASRTVSRLFQPNIFCTKNFCCKADKVTSAGILVIGNEILKGEVLDTNSNFLAREIHKLGLRLQKISVIGDNLQEISKEVKYFSRTFDYVITTGGIGPTHDDITYEAVALAFNEPLYLNPVLKEICMKFYNTTDVNSPGMKLAYIPQSARLTFRAPNGSKMNYPNVSTQNVYMFPGIPEFCRKSFLGLGKTLFKSNRKFYSKCVYCNLTEDKIVDVLDTLVKQFPDVQFGSYPKLNDSVYKVKVTIESCREKSANRAYETLLTLLPHQFVIKRDKK